MAKIAKTGDRKKVMDTTRSTDCPKCSKPTRIVKRVKDRERGALKVEAARSSIGLSCFYGLLQLIKNGEVSPCRVGGGRDGTTDHELIRPGP